MFDLTPDPVAFRIGTIPIYWYGIAYAAGLMAVYLLLVWLARRAGRDPELVGNGMIIVAVAALIGGRLYHVIDQWDVYSSDLARIVLPPYSGLGVYGGLATGTLAGALYARWKGEPVWRWADIIAPSLFLMQAIGRWGNFFNQELYGPPTTLPWGIPIECANRVSAYACEAFPFETTRFHPLFLYESISGFLGMAFLIFLGTRFRARLRPGDLLLIFFVWYGIVRFGLETLRVENWTLLGIPTAMIVSAVAVAIALALLAYRHRPNRPPDDEPVAAEPAESDGFGGAADAIADAPDEQPHPG